MSDTSKKPLAPKLTFVKSPSGYAVLGWDEFSDWAVRNDQTWARVAWEVVARRLQHEDALRLLCAALLLEKHGLLWLDQPATVPPPNSPTVGPSHRLTGDNNA